MRPECPHLLVTRPFYHRSSTICGGKIRRLFGRPTTAAPIRRIGLARWFWTTAVSTRSPSYVCDICLGHVASPPLSSTDAVNFMQSHNPTAEETNMGHSRRPTAASFRRAIRGVLTRKEGGIGTLSDVASGVGRLITTRKASQLSHNERILAACRQFPRCLLQSDVQQRALRMSRFAAAAYGPAYRDGFHSSVVANVLLSLPIFYRRVVVPPEAHCAAALHLLATSPQSNSHHDLVAVEANAVDAACEASFVVFVDHRNGEIVVAFRGTTSRGDMMTDILPNLVPLLQPPLLPTGCSSPARQTAASVAGTGGGAGVPPMRAPEGFVRSVQDAQVRVTRILLDVARQNANRLRQRPYRLVFTGHSLGAIQANLFHLLVRHDTTFRDTLGLLGIDTRCCCVYGFAPAPCLASWSSPAAAETHPLSGGESEVHNFIFGLDVVPRLQTSSLRRLLRSGEKHVVSRFKDHLAQRTTAERELDDDDEELAIPGNVWWFDPSSSRGSTSMTASPGERESITTTGVYAHRIAPRRTHAAGSSSPTCRREKEDNDVTMVTWNDVPLGTVALEHHFLANLCRALWRSDTAEGPCDPHTDTRTRI